MVVKTDVAGEPFVTNKEFVLGLFPGEEYNFTVNWGDNTTSVISLTTTSASQYQYHQYSVPGTYNVQITENIIGGFPRIYFGSGGSDSHKVMQISQWGSGTWKSMNGAFTACHNMTISAIDTATAKTSGVTDFTYAWAGCSSLISFPLLNTSAGKNFFGAWSDCVNLTSFPLLDTSSAISISRAWYNCIRLSDFPTLNFKSLQNADLSFHFVTLNDTSYSNLLINFNNQNKIIVNNTTFSAGFSRYNSTAAISRNALILRGWSFVDGGPTGSAMIAPLMPIGNG
jgi:hypothetical protein